MTSPRPALAVFFLSPIIALLTACGDGTPPADQRSATEREAANAGYLSPPRVEGVASSSAGVSVQGGGPANSRVMLDGAGKSYRTGVDASGRWRVQTEAAAEPRLFTIIAENEGRRIEAEGRLLVLPDGRALLLRPGHGALPVNDGAGGPPRLVSIDVASDGAAAASGYAQPSTRVVTVVNGTPPAEDLVVGQGAADRAGRFAVILASPLPPGAHSVVVNTPEGVARAQVIVTSTEDPGERPFAAEQAAGGWRITWRLPRGGVQTTYVLGEGE